MSNDVFANGNEIACKAGDGKVIAAFPDVCLSPPSPPAGPIPIPYPDTSFSKDMKNGSKTVKISGKEVMLKDKSYYKTSPLGDEAATKGLGAGVITHVITGKTYFTAWSMDVKFEGKNVDRHIDLTTSNHMSKVGNSMIMANLDSMAPTIIEEGKCPCCKSPACPAKIEPGDEPLTFNEYYGIDERAGKKNKLTPGALKKQEELAEMLEKKKNCFCKNPPTKVFPEPPCNVFRKPNKDRKRAIDDKWFHQGGRDKFVAWHKKKHGRDIPAQTTINHVVPRSAGGCPTSPHNLQADAELCQNCKDIDAIQTKWQGK